VKDLDNITQLLQKHEMLKLRTGSELLEDENGTLYIRNGKQMLKVFFEKGELAAMETENIQGLRRLRGERFGGD
jgi:RNA binding exosome subunit